MKQFGKYFKIFLILISKNFILKIYKINFNLFKRENRE